MRAGINLLPGEVRRPRVIPWGKMLVTLLGLAVASSLTAGWWWLDMQETSARAELGSLQREEARLQAEVTALRELERARALQLEKQRFYETTLETRPFWEAVRALGQVSPAGIRVDTLGIAAGGALVMEGVSPDLGTVAELMNALAASGLYVSNRVVFPEPFKDKPEVRVPFRLTATLGGGG